jgi:hypothetical protein
MIPLDISKITTFIDAGDIKKRGNPSSIENLVRNGLQLLGGSRKRLVGPRKVTWVRFGELGDTLLVF